MSEGLAAVLVALVGQIGVIAGLFARQGRRLNRIEVDANTAAMQTANSHADADHPNLRDDLDAKFRGVQIELQEINGKLMDLHSDDEGLENTVSRQQIRWERAIARARSESGEQIDRIREEIPDMIRRQIARHIPDECPVRTTHVITQLGE